MALNGETIIVFTVLLQESPTRTGAQRAREQTLFAEGAHELGPPRPSRSERERQRTKRRIWHLPIDSSSPEPNDAQTRQPARDQAPTVEPCDPSPIGTGPA